jgi:hypothetical protein
MQKALTRLTFLFAATCLAATSTGFAQQAKKMPTAAELKKNLAVVEASTEGESDKIDRLLTHTTRQLVTYLGAHELSTAAAKNMGLDVTPGPKDASSLKVYTFSYSSGGTRGTIDRPVLQWKNTSGQLFAYAPDVECGFYEIHKLAISGRTLYLLIGSEKGDGRCDTQQAYVIELKGNYLLLDQKAFGERPLLLLCNVDLTFDASKQTLRIDFAPEEESEDIMATQDRLRNYDYGRKPGAKSIALQFSGGRFVQKR